MARKNIERYGAPYKGSKNLIARDVVNALPPADMFVDLFAGGCAVTHAALLSGRYRRIVCNDVCPLAVRLFRLAVEGGLENETRWISRETFEAQRGIDPYITYAWSFGNDGRNYCYGRAIEPYKRALHYAVLHDDWGPYADLMPETLGAAKARLAGCADTADRRVLIARAVIEWLRVNGTPELLTSHPFYSSAKAKGGKNSRVRLQNLQSLESLESLERLERLQSLRGLGSISDIITYSAKDYREVQIPPGAVVYCDPPYAGTSGYGVEFDHDAFRRYVEALSRRGVLVVVSEYTMPSPRFVPVWRKAKRVTYSSNTNILRTECLFVHNAALPLYKKMMGKEYTLPDDGVIKLFQNG